MGFPAPSMPFVGGPLGQLPGYEEQRRREEERRAAEDWANRPMQPAPPAPQPKTPLQLLVEQLKAAGVPDNELVAAIQRLADMFKEPEPTGPEDVFARDIDRERADAARRATEQARADEQARALRTLASLRDASDLPPDQFDDAMSFAQQFDERMREAAAEREAINAFSRQNPLTGSYLEALRTLPDENKDKLLETVPADKLDTIYRLLSGRISLAALTPEVLEILNTQADKWRRDNLVTIVQKQLSEGIVTVSLDDSAVGVVPFIAPSDMVTGTGDFSRDVQNMFLAEADKRLRDRSVTKVDIFDPTVIQQSMLSQAVGRQLQAESVESVVVTNGALFGIGGADLLLDYKRSQAVDLIPVTRTIQVGGKPVDVQYASALMNVPIGTIDPIRHKYAAARDKLTDAQLISVLGSFTKDEIQREVYEGDFSNRKIRTQLMEYGLSDLEALQTLQFFEELVNQNALDGIFDLVTVPGKALGKAAAPGLEPLGMVGAKVLAGIGAIPVSNVPVMGGAAAIMSPLWLPSTSATSHLTDFGAGLLGKDLNISDYVPTLTTTLGDYHIYNVGDGAGAVIDSLDVPAEKHQQLVMTLSLMARSEDKKKAFLGSLGLAGLFGAEVAVAAGITVGTAGTGAPVWGVVLSGGLAAMVPASTAFGAVGSTTLSTNLINELNMLPANQRSKFGRLWASLVLIPGLDEDVAIQLREMRESQERNGIWGESFGYLDPILDKGNALIDGIYLGTSDPLNLVAPEAVGLDIPQAIRNHRIAEEMVEYPTRALYARLGSRAGDTGPENLAQGALQLTKPFGKTTAEARFNRADDITVRFANRVFLPLIEDVVANGDIVGREAQEGFIKRLEDIYGTADREVDGLAFHFGKARRVNRVHREAEDLFTEVFKSDEYAAIKKGWLARNISTGADITEQTANYRKLSRDAQAKLYGSFREFVNTVSNDMIELARRRALFRFGLDPDHLPTGLRLSRMARSTVGAYLETTSYALRNMANNMFMGFVNGINPGSIIGFGGTDAYLRTVFPEEAIGQIRATAAGIADVDLAAATVAEAQGFEAFRRMITGGNGISSFAFDSTNIHDKKRMTALLTMNRRLGARVEAAGKLGVYARGFQRFYDKARAEIADTSLIPAFLDPTLQQQLRGKIKEASPAIRLSQRLRKEISPDGTIHVRPQWTIRDLMSKNDASIRFLEEHPAYEADINNALEQVILRLEDGDIGIAEARTLIMDRVVETYYESLVKLEDEVAILGPDAIHVVNQRAIDQTIDIAEKRFAKGVPYTEQQLLVDAATHQFSYLGITHYVETKMEDLADFAHKLGATDVWIRGNEAVRATSKAYTDEMRALAEQQDALYVAAGLPGGIDVNEIERFNAEDMLRRDLTGAMTKYVDDFDKAREAREAARQRFGDQMRALRKRGIQKKGLSDDQYDAAWAIQRKRNELTVAYRKEHMKNIQAMQGELQDIAAIQTRTAESFDSYRMRLRAATQGMPEGKTRTVDLLTGDRLEYGGDRFKVMHVASNGVVRVEDVVTGKPAVLRNIRDLGAIVYRAHESGLIRGDVEFVRALRTLTLSDTEVSVLGKFATVEASLGAAPALSDEELDTMRALKRRLGLPNNYSAKRVFEHPEVQARFTQTTDVLNKRMRELSLSAASMYRRTGKYRMSLDRDELARLMGGMAPEDIPTVMQATFWNAVLHRKALRDLDAGLDVKLAEIVKPPAVAYSPEQGKLLDEFVERTQAEINQATNAADVYGRTLSDWVLHNYTNTYNFDYFMRFLFPWELWMTRTGAKASVLIAQHPWLFSKIDIIRDAHDEAMKALPPRVRRGFGPIPLPFAGLLPDHVAGDWYSAVYQTFLPTSVLAGYVPFEDKQTLVARLLSGDEAGIGFGASPLAVMAFKKLGFYGEDAKENWMGNSLPFVDNYANTLTSLANIGFPQVPNAIRFTEADFVGTKLMINGMYISGDISEEQATEALAELEEIWQGKERRQLVNVRAANSILNIHAKNGVLKQAIERYNDQKMVTTTLNKWAPLALILYTEDSQKYEAAKEKWAEFKLRAPTKNMQEEFFRDNPELQLMSLMSNNIGADERKARIIDAQYYNELEKIHTKYDELIKNEIELNGVSSPKVDVLNTQEREAAKALALEAHANGGGILDNTSLSMIGKDGMPLPFTQWWANVVRTLTQDKYFTFVTEDGHKVVNRPGIFAIRESLLGVVSGRTRLMVEQEIFGKDFNEDAEIARAIEQFYFAARKRIGEQVKEAGVLGAEKTKLYDELSSGFLRPKPQEIWYILQAWHPGFYTLKDVRDKMPSVFASLDAASQLGLEGKVQALEATGIGFFAESGEPVHTGNVARFKQAIDDRQLVFDALNAGAAGYEAYRNWTADVEEFFGSGKVGRDLIALELFLGTVITEAKNSRKFDKMNELIDKQAKIRFARELLGVPENAVASYEDVFTAGMRYRGLEYDAIDTAKKFKAGRITSEEYIASVTDMIKDGLFITDDGELLSGEAAEKAKAQEKAAYEASAAATGEKSGLGTITRGVDEDGDGVIDRRYTVDELLALPDFAKFKNDILVNNFQPGDDMPEDRTLAMLLENGANGRAEIARLFNDMYDLTQLDRDSELGKETRRLPHVQSVLFGQSVQRVRTATYILAIDDMLKMFQHEPQFKKLDVPSANKFKAGLPAEISRVTGRTIETKTQPASAEGARESQVQRAKDEIATNSGFVQLIYGVNTWDDATRVAQILFGSMKPLEDVQKFWSASIPIPAASQRRLRFMAAVVPIEGATTFARWLAGLQLIYQSGRVFQPSEPALPRSRFPVAIRERRF